jgi:hypothetical protein
MQVPDLEYGIPKFTALIAKSSLLRLSTLRQCQSLQKLAREKVFLNAFGFRLLGETQLEFVEDLDPNNSRKSISKVFEELMGSLDKTSVDRLQIKLLKWDNAPIADENLSIEIPEDE